MYQTQYQNPINFSKEFFIQLNDEFNKLNKTINQTIIDLSIKGIKMQLDKKEINSEFVNALEDDLNFPNAIKAI
ncbi:MAG: hypothetical protein K2L48_02375 [Mycoplasmoidaceae bacterium]|nr:hypothetical protein [Mycoplasmoidaceae bacterium]